MDKIGMQEGRGRILPTREALLPFQTSYRIVARISKAAEQDQSRTTQTQTACESDEALLYLTA